MTVQPAAPPRVPLARVRSWLDFWYLLYRFPALSFSALLPVLGAASVTRDLGPRRLLGLFAIGFLFHGFSYISNDLIDLRLDRSEPMRADYPLVRGQLAPGTAWVLALIHVPLSFLVAARLAGSAAGCWYLLLAYALLTIYNLWGKRCLFPPLTDAVQALGWCALTLHGASVVGGAATSALEHLLAYVFGYVLLINGVHGPLRDLPNDYRSGARTTAILLQVRPSGATGVILSPALGLYTLLLQVALAWITLSHLRWNVPGGLSSPTAALSLALCLFAGALLVAAYVGRHDDLRLLTVGYAHLVVTLAVLPAAFATAAGPAVAATAFALFLLPVASYWLRNRNAEPVR